MTSQQPELEAIEQHPLSKLHALNAQMATLCNLEIDTTPEVHYLVMNGIVTELVWQPASELAPSSQRTLIFNALALKGLTGRFLNHLFFNLGADCQAGTHHEFTDNFYLSLLTASNYILCKAAADAALEAEIV